jgi:hypothetical protein
MPLEPIKINYDDCLVMHAKVVCNLMTIATQNPVFADQRVIDNIANSFKAIRNDLRRELFQEMLASQVPDLKTFTREFGLKYDIIKEVK